MASTYPALQSSYPTMAANPQLIPGDMPSGPPPSYETAVGLSKRVSTCQPQTTIKQRCTDYFYQYDLLKGTTLNKRKIVIAAIIGVLVGLATIGIVGGTLAATGGAPLVIGLGVLGAAAFSTTVLGAFFGTVASQCSTQHAGQVLRPATDEAIRALRDRAMKQCQQNCLKIQQCRTANRAIEERRAHLQQQATDEEIRNRPVREHNRQLRTGLHLANGMMNMTAHAHYPHHCRPHYHGHCRPHYNAHCSPHYPAMTNHLLIDAALPDPATPYADQLRADDYAHRNNSRIERQHINEATRLCQLYTLNLEDADELNPSVSLCTDTTVNAADLPA